MDWPVIKRLMSTIWPYRFQVLLALFCGTVTGFVAGAVTFVIKHGLEALEQRSYEKLVWVIVILAAIFFVDVLFRFLRNTLLRTVAEKCVSVIRQQVVERMVAMSVPRFESQPAAQWSSRVMYDASTLPSAMEGLGYYISAPVSFMFLLSIAFYRDWRLTLCVFFAAPLVALIFKKVGSSVQRNANRNNMAMGDINQALTELGQSMKTIKVFSGESWFIHDFKIKCARALKSIQRMILVQEMASPLTELVMGLAAAGAFFYLSLRVLHGEQSIGDLAQVVAALGLLQEPIRRLNGVHTRLMQGVAGARRLFELVDSPVEPLLPKVYSPSRTPVGVVFNTVSFSYVLEQEARSVLDHVSFEIKPGEWLGLRGKSGSGKSTIAHLIPRLYEPHSGSILFNSKNIMDWDLFELRSHISIVNQDIVLFHDSVLNNIRFGNPQASEKEVQAALKAAHVDEFIDKLPQGLATLVGDRGGKLSGGQRQRIGIARALLKNAPLLILDEATSSLDSQSEAEVQAALDVLMKDRTVLIIAHRESSLNRAHRILELKDGQLQ